MKKVSVDQVKCIGCGTCVALCPACFKLADDGKAKVIGSECKDCDPKEVAENCPVEAVKIED